MKTSMRCILIQFTLAKIGIYTKCLKAYQTTRNLHKLLIGLKIRISYFNNNLVLYMKIYTSLVKMRKQFAFNFFKKHEC